MYPFYLYVHVPTACNTRLQKVDQNVSLDTQQTYFEKLSVIK